MTELTTLRAMAGLPLQPPSLASSTLILIDCQNTYTSGVMELEGVQAALDEAAALLDRARSAGIPIIHIQHDDGPGSLYDIAGESGAIVSRVAPRDGEPVVVKNYPNSFVSTSLDDRLKRRSPQIGERRESGRRGLHDAYVCELHRQGSVQSRLRADGGCRRDRDPVAAGCRRRRRTRDNTAGRESGGVDGSVRRGGPGFGCAPRLTAPRGPYLRKTGRNLRRTGFSRRMATRRAARSRVDDERIIIC